MGEKSCPHRDSIPDRPASSSITIPTELPGPHNNNVRKTVKKEQAKILQEGSTCITEVK